MNVNWLVRFTSRSWARRYCLGRFLGLVFLLVALTLAGACSPGGESSVELLLEVDVFFKESAFRLPGPVTARVEFKNRSREALLMNKAFNYQDCRLDFHIVSPSGGTLEQIRFLLGRRPPLGLGDFQEIPAGRTYGVDINLAQWFQFTEEGVYKVEVEYSNSHTGREQGISAWTGRIRSPDRTFELMKPR